jgi:hypothetical protein
MRGIMLPAQLLHLAEKRPFSHVSYGIPANSATSIVASNADLAWFYCVTGTLYDPKNPGCNQTGESLKSWGSVCRITLRLNASLTSSKKFSPATLASAIRRQAFGDAARSDAKPPLGLVYEAVPGFACAW